MATDTFLAALADAREAIDRALDALNTHEHPDPDGLLALIAAQTELRTAAHKFETGGEHDAR